MDRIVYSQLSHISSIMYCKQRLAACVLSASLREAQQAPVLDTAFYREGGVSGLSNQGKNGMSGKLNHPSTCLT